MVVLSFPFSDLSQNKRRPALAARGETLSGGKIGYRHEFRPRRISSFLEVAASRNSSQSPFFRTRQFCHGLLVIADLKGEDLILCQITSQARADGYSITLDAGDFVDGGLNQSSHIRANRLFTADSAIVVYRAGHVAERKLTETVERLIEILGRR